MKSLLSVLFSFMCLIRNILIFICPLETFLGSNKNETKFYLYNSSIFINSQKVSRGLSLNNRYWWTLIRKCYPLLSDSVLELSMLDTYEKVKYFFANQLYIWGHFQQRLCVLKTSNFDGEQTSHKKGQLNFAVDCLNESHNGNGNDKNDIEAAEETTPQFLRALTFEKATSPKPKADCGTKANVTVQCRGCLRPSLNCVICLLPIKGLASCCGLCGHPGHLKHIKNWFVNQDQCAVPGCECYCMSNWIRDHELS